MSISTNLPAAEPPSTTNQHNPAIFFSAIQFLILFILGGVPFPEDPGTARLGNLLRLMSGSDANAEWHRTMQLWGEDRRQG